MHLLPQSLQKLAQRWNIELKLETDLEWVDSDDYPCTYALNAQGHLIGLNLVGTAVSELALDEDMQYLEVLNLGRTALRSLSLPAQLEHLRSLQLYRCQDLTAIKWGTALPKLEYADLSECALQQLELPEDLPRLKKLYLQKNALQRIHFAAACPALEFLDLSGNQLSSLSFPAGFAQLRYLYLNNNQLESLHCAGEMPQLDILHLRNNALRSIKPGFLDPFPGLVNLYLSGNPLNLYLRGHFEENDRIDSPAFLRQYFQDLQQGARVDNECKVLLIGDGRAGKSCIVERLVRDRFIENNPSTNGIIIDLYPLEPYLLQLWDFAGQDIYHATHRLFMQAGVVYILAWNKTTQTQKSMSLEEGGELRHYDNYGVKYWLNYARTLGGNSPVIVVQTQSKADGKYQSQELHELEEENPDLHLLRIDSQPDSTQENGYPRLLTELQLAAEKVASITEIPESAYQLRKALRERQAEKQISMEQYLELAQSCGLQADPEERLVNWLVKSGVVYYQKGLFNNQIILDQQWAINAVYDLFKRSGEGSFFHQIAERKGWVRGSDLQRIWVKHSPEEQELFLSFLRSCEMCFEIKDSEQQSLPFAERTFILPQLLREDRPKVIDSLWKREKSSLYLRYRHRFLHYGVIQSFIVQTQQLVTDVEERIWRTGILLEEEEQMVQVEADTKAFEITLRLTPQSVKLLIKVRNLLKKLQDQPGEESVSSDGQNFVSLQKLEDKKHKAEIEAGNDVDVPVAPLLLFLQRDEQLVFEDSAEKPFHKRDTGSFQNPDLPLPAIETLDSKLEIPKGSDGKIHILFTSANPKNDLQVEKESKLVQNEAQGRNLDIRTLPAVDRSSLIKRVTYEKPQIVHFSGHSNIGNLQFVNSRTDQAELISNEELLEIFEHFVSMGVRCVVLCSCWSYSQAQEISELGIPVVGMLKPIDDQVAIQFSQDMYDLLSAANASLDEVFRSAKLMMVNKEDRAIPSLWYRGKRVG